MAEDRLSNGEFFTRLAALLKSTHPKDHATITLTQKRLATSTSIAPSDPMSDLQPPADPLPILMRATNGNPKKTADLSRNLTRKEREAKRVRLSTVVAPSELDAFFERYAEVARAGMAEGMRKRDRSKRKKKEKRKKEGAGVVESGKK